jgi:hypothetical protein
MKKHVAQRKIRKIHRYLGLLLGIQFLAWTIGGLYFSWTNIESIRGQDLQVEKKTLNINKENPLFNKINELYHGVIIEEIMIVEILGKVYYQIHAINPGKKIFLVDFETLELRSPLSQQEAEAIALQSLKSPGLIKSTSYLTETSNHHEYRNKSLPAYAVSFQDPIPLTVYVASELGTVQSFRSNSWRVFDFLWMLHTMDYESRDNFNNTLLRIFSIFGLITILSGFILYFLTIKR